MSKYTSTMIAFMFFLQIPIIALWFFTEPLLILCGQDPEISKMAGEYIRYLAPGLFPFMIYECIRRFVQAQSMMIPPLVVTMICVPVNLTLQYFLCWNKNFGFGFIGAAVATSLTYCCLPVLLCSWVAYGDGGQRWAGFRVYTHLFKPLGSLGFSGALAVCSEWWVYEIISLLSGILGKTPLAAQTIVLSTTSLTFMIPLGFSIAASTRVGNSFGSGRWEKARLSSRAGMFLGFAIATITCTFLIAVKDVWGLVWTSEEDVVQLVSRILPIAAVYQLSDALAVISGGVMRGVGKQKAAALYNLIGHYMVGVPMSLLLAFKLGMGLAGIIPRLVPTVTFSSLGLFVGLVVGISFVAVGLLLHITFNIDWTERGRIELTDRPSEVGEMEIEDDED